MLDTFSRDRDSLYQELKGRGDHDVNWWQCERRRRFTLLSRSFKAAQAPFIESFVANPAHVESLKRIDALLHQAIEACLRATSGEEICCFDRLIGFYWVRLKAAVPPENPPTDRNLEAIPEAPKTENPLPSKPVKARRKPRGRSPDTDATEDRHTAERWRASGYRTHKEFADAIGKSVHDVKHALDRHRHRKKPGKTARR
jgi:hypothetical protein